MPAYAYDVPPHLYVRLAPQIGADLAVVGSLADGGYEQLLGEPQLFGGLQQSALVQVLLDLSHVPNLNPTSLRWTVLTFAPGLAGGGMRHLAIVLPPSSISAGDDLRALAGQQLPDVAVGCFGSAPDATRWLASRVAGVGPSTTPDEVRSLASQGQWLDAVARYRALTAASLADTITVIEGLLRDAPRSDGHEPTSLIPSTEVPSVDEPLPAAPVILPAAPEPHEPGPDSITRITTHPVASSPTATQASLGEMAQSASQLASAPTQFDDEIPASGTARFEDEMTTARELDDSLFPSGEGLPEEVFLGARLRDLEPLFRSTFARVWFVASEDGENLPLRMTEEGQQIDALEESRDDAPLALSGARLMAMLRSGANQLRFSPGSPAELTLRNHQFPHAREFLSGLLVEEHLDSLPGDPRARERCLNHDFLVLLERHNGVDRVVLTQEKDGRTALLFTLPDVLARYLQEHRDKIEAYNLCILAEQGDSLLEKLLILPIQSIHINPAGPSSKILSRDQIKQILRSEAAAPVASRAAPSVPRPAPRSAPRPAPVASSSVAPPAPASAAPAASPSPPARSPSVVPPASTAAESVHSSELTEFRRFHARSLAEVHFFLDARGFERQERYQWQETREGVVVWAFLVKGPTGKQERFEFTVDAEHPAPQDGYFGAGPSPLFGPVELLQRAGAMSRSSSGSPLGLSPEELAQATGAAELAYILVMEALRHYGQGDSPLESSLKTDEERQALAKDPARFQRARVEEMARAYWYVATQLGEALRGRP